MKYFVTDTQRKGTIYHEFYKGKWDEETFWKADSLCLHDDYLSRVHGFTEAIIAVFPNYYPSGNIEINPVQWEQIEEIIRKKQDKDALELYLEANSWVQDTFSEFGCFTILGI